MKPTARFFRLEGAFPDGDDMPAELAEGVFVFEIARLVAFDLGFPGIDAGLWEAEVGTDFMSVPEEVVARR